MNTENGLSLKTTWHDDAGETKSFTGTVDSSSVKPAECTIKIRVGYDIESFFSLQRGKSMKQCQQIFNEIMPQYTVSNLTEFRNAVIDGAILIEKLRMDDVNRAITESDISAGDTPKKRQRWGLAQKYLRQQRPNIHVFIDRKQYPSGQWDRVYLMDSRIGDWCWGGFQDVSKINFTEVYKNALRTEQHCKNLDCLCGAIAKSI